MKRRAYLFWSLGHHRQSLFNFIKGLAGQLVDRVHNLIVLNRLNLEHELCRILV